MGIKYDIYKYFTNKRVLWNITQTKIDNLRSIMERFEVSNVTFDTSYMEGKALKKVLNKFSLSVNNDGAKHIIITDKKSNDSTNAFFFTVKDFLAMLDTPEYIVNTPIPRIFNTLENIYDNFLVVGQGSYADTIHTYLSGNPNIKVRRFSSNDMESPEFTALLDECASDLFVIIADLRPYRQLTYSTGVQLHTLYLRRLYAPFGKTTEYLMDLNKHILPKLRAGGVKVVWIYIPDESRLTRHDELQKKLRYWERLRRYTPDLFNRIRAKHEENQYLQSELNAVINDNTRGYSTNYHNGQYINFDNGFRRTVGNTSSKTNSVYVFGPCFVRGSSYEDDKTIPSLIKAQIDDRYSVYNMGSSFHTINYIMREKEYKSGDIVVVFSPSTKASSTTTEFDTEIDLTDVYNNIVDVEKHVFDIAVHFDHVIAEKIAAKIAQAIKGLDSYSNCEKPELPPNDTDNLLMLSGTSTINNSNDSSTFVSFGPAHKRIASVESLADKSLFSWLEAQKAHIKPSSGRNGAIVMNCNPFTKGHRYLIEQASKQVDNLYIFVVEEDKSEFKFADRINLVKLGTADLGNVTVLSSGKYVISTQTLPGYFDKKNLSTIDLNAQNDLEYFLSIAQYFGITVRFAGEEPIDMFTNQYNTNMKQILPKYGIEFIEISRMQTGNTVISASAVRKAIHDGNWDLVKELVPVTTYDYLKSLL